MKRILVIDDIISIGKSGASVSLPIFSSLELESILVPSSVSYSSFNNNFTQNLSKNFDSYITGFSDDMIHFDAIYFTLSKSSSLDKLNSLITSSFSNDTLIICNTRNENPSQDILVFSNIVIGEEALKDKLSSRTHYLISFNKTISNDKRAVVIFDNETKEAKYIYYKKWYEEFSSLSDLFSAIVSAFYINGMDIEKCVRNAIKFITQCFNDTTDPLYNFYGLSFEKKLPELKNSGN